MRFTTARLCGGKALMAVSSEELDIDPVGAAEALGERGFEVTQADEMMAVFQWNGMEVTLYRQGKVMFFPLEDRAACISYATGILESLLDRPSRNRRVPCSSSGRASVGMHTVHASERRSATSEHARSPGPLASLYILSPYRVPWSRPT